jgi:hypothetical protein
MTDALPQPRFTMLRESGNPWRVLMRREVEGHDVVRVAAGCLLSRSRDAVADHIESMPMLPQALRNHARGGALVFNQQIRIAASR